MKKTENTPNGTNDISRKDAIKKMGGGTDGVKKKIRQCFIAYQINEILE